MATLDRPIKFYRSLAGALRGTGRLSADNTVRIQGALQFDKIQAGSARTDLSKSPMVGR
jgi:hypothetical protein